MEGADLYDDFGNYMGPISETSSSDGEGRIEHDLPRHGVSREQSEVPHDGEGFMEIIPHEEKEYYASAAEVFGPSVETLVQLEDTQTIEEQIVPRKKSNKEFELIERKLPETTFSWEYFAGLMNDVTRRVRHVAIVGNLHSGKTSLVDLLHKLTHSQSTASYGGVSRGRAQVEFFAQGHSNNSFVAPMSSLLISNFTDVRKDERDRKISTRSVPMSVIMSTADSRSHLLHFIDTPGHINFFDEVEAALRLTDGIVLVVEALEGLTAMAEKALHAALRNNMAVILVINKIDRLIAELRLPPNDAYSKLKYVIHTVNESIAAYTKLLGRDLDTAVLMDPLQQNVCFASTRYGFIFSLESFAGIYINLWNAVGESHLDRHSLAQCLWGDVYFDPSVDPETGHPEPVFTVNVPDKTTTELSRGFVAFILEPLYKIICYVVSEEREDLKYVLEELGVWLPKEPTFETKKLLKAVCEQFFVDATSLVDALVKHIPNPLANSRNKLSQIYTGNQEGELFNKMVNMDRDAPLVVFTAKNFHRANATVFDTYGRVACGVLKKGMTVKVLGPTYSPEDPEDSCDRTVTHLWIPQGRYRVEIEEACPGSVVLIGGCDKAVGKTATLVDSHALNLWDANHPEEPVRIFKPLRHRIPSTIKVAVEAVNPSELPRVIEGLRRIDKAYLGSQTKVEESGEHIIVGTGELYLDCIMHDLRVLYSEAEAKVSDPAVLFCETVIDTSALKCFAETPNKKNKLFMIAEPLEPGIVEDVENGLIRPEGEPDSLASLLMDKYDYDELASQSVWAFGPEDSCTNLLINDTIPGEVDDTLLRYVNPYIVQGFNWATKGGPLFEEPMRNVKFKLLDCHIAAEPLQRAPGQIIPTARRAAYSAFLLATPRLMEPILFTEITCPADSVSAVYNVLARRRGHVVKDFPNPGTPLYVVHAYLPAIDSFGFETDLRTHTSGQSFGMSTFDRWAVVPGDPLDKGIVIPPLEPSPPPHLARDFLLKTRRRKGLSEDVAIQNFFDDPMLAQLAADAQSAA